MADESDRNDVSNHAESHHLDYRDPQSDVPRSQIPGAAVGGFVLSIVILGCAGMGPYVQTHMYPPQPPPNWPMVMIYGVVAVASTLGIVLMRRVGRAGWSAFFIGLLLGAATTALIEGVCFAVS